MLNIMAWHTNPTVNENHSDSGRKKVSNLQLYLPYQTLCDSWNLVVENILEAVTYEFSLMQNNMEWHTNSPVNWNQSDSGMELFLKPIIALTSPQW